MAEIHRDCGTYTVGIQMVDDVMGTELGIALRQLDRICTLIDAGCPECHVPVGARHDETCPYYLASPDG